MTTAAQILRGARGRFEVRYVQEENDVSSILDWLVVRVEVNRRAQPCEKSRNLHLLRSGLQAKFCLLIELLFCFLFWQEILLFRLSCVPQVMVKRIWGDSQDGGGTKTHRHMHII